MLSALLCYLGARAWLEEHMLLPCKVYSQPPSCFNNVYRPAGLALLSTASRWPLFSKTSAGCIRERHSVHPRAKIIL